MRWRPPFGIVYSRRGSPSSSSSPHAASESGRRVGLFAFAFMRTPPPPPLCLTLPRGFHHPLWAPHGSGWAGPGGWSPRVRHRVRLSCLRPVLVLSGGAHLALTFSKHRMGFFRWAGWEDMLGRKARRPRYVGVNITGFLFLFFLEIGLVCVCIALAYGMAYFVWVLGMGFP